MPSSEKRIKEGATSSKRDKQEYVNKWEELVAEILQKANFNKRISRLVRKSRVIWHYETISPDYLQL